MSVFGYGSTYNPTAAQAYQPYQGTPVAPSVAPAMAPINFSPSVTSPWENPGKYLAGTNSSSSKNWLGMTDSESYFEDWRQKPWENPIAKAFGAENSLAGPTAQKQQGIAANWNSGATPNINQYGIRGIAGPGAVQSGINPNNPFDQVGQIMPGKGGQGGGLSTIINPKTPQQLYAQIGQLDANQLQLLTSRLPSITQGFAQASQDYSNAYANTNFSRQAMANRPLSARSGVSSNPAEAAVGLGDQARTQDWLQQAYNQLLGRLNENYLL
jgi:hypothetical protein